MAYKILLFVWYCLYIVIVCASGNTRASIEIKREQHDKFIPQNLHLEREKSKKNAENLCKSFNAECENDECKYCQCNDEEGSTFLLLTSSSTTGNCTKDQDIIPESVPNGNFALRNENMKSRFLCLVVTGKQTKKLSGTDCSSSPLNMRWIWINETGKIQLLNVMTLQCVEFIIPMSACLSNNDTIKYDVVITQCNKTNGQQHICCSDKQETYIYVKTCQNQRNCFLEIDEHSKRAISRRRSDGQTWKNDNEVLNWTAITYKGCYRFQNEKFMLYLDKDVCPDPCNRNFSAPIFSENSECNIKWSESTIMQSEMLWKKDSKITKKKLIDISGVSKDRKMLMIKKEAFNIFNGSLLKLIISCESKTRLSKRESHCLLLKFKKLPGVKSTMTKKPSKTTPTTKITDTTVILPMTTAKMTDDVIISPNDKHKENEDSSVVTIVIAVSVSVLIIILVLVLAYFYRKRAKTTAKSTDNQGNMNNPSYSKVCYEVPNVYETPAPDKQEASPARYEYIDNAIANPKPTQPELNYDYATNTEIPRTTLNAKPEGAAVQPELKYDYARPDTEIPRTTLNTKPGSDAAQPELKYDYARDTEIPRPTLNAKPEGAAAQPELKYDYARDTEIPRTTFDPMAKSKADAVSDQPELKYDYAANNEVPKLDSKAESDPSSNPMYHSLEELSPPQTAVYSILEEANDDSKVKYDTPHSGDPV